MNTEMTPQSDAPVTRRGPFVTPAVDIYQGETGWLVRADLPGVLIDDLSVDLDENRLTIEASRGPGADTEPGKGVPTLGGYRRTILVPDIVDAENIEARLVHGVLELTLPRDTRGRTRKITVTGT